MGETTLKRYVAVTKPGIIMGNIITATAGYFLAADGHFDFWLFVSLLVGTSLGIASACVFNNYLDRGIDEKMSRTKRRALVQGTITHRNALLYATVLGVIGFAILAIGTNWKVVLVGAIGMLDYLLFYSIGKRTTVHSTLIGSISGAMPPVAGYVAVTDRFDIGALVLFLLLVCWQMPHFYAIGMFRARDYAAAGLPVLPVKQGMRSAKIYILAYIALFTLVGCLLTVFGVAGVTFLIVSLLLGASWLWKGWQGWRAVNDVRWARGMFHYSLIVNLAFSVALILNAWLP